MKSITLLKKLKINIPQYKIDNVNIGENTLAGTLRYFARGSIDFDNFYHNEILKKYFKSALVTKSAMENLLNKKNMTQL